jgi:hypothetical protein
MGNTNVYTDGQYISAHKIQKRSSIDENTINIENVFGKIGGTVSREEKGNGNQLDNKQKLYNNQIK